MNKTQAIIVDLDGTLANCDHRRHFVDGTHEKQDWRSFYESMTEDTVNEWCLTIIADCCFVDMHGWDRAPLLVTGRPEEYRQLTQNWLNKTLMDSMRPNGRNVQANPKLLMRKTGDYRDDTIIKEEIYKEHIEPHYDVMFVIDDRKKVVDMWRRMGLVCLHCADGDF